MSANSRPKRRRETKLEKQRREFWELVDRVSKEVESWPPWKRVLFPEDHLEIKPVLPRKR